MPVTGSQGPLFGLASVGMVAGNVLADQLGLPLPAIPALLIAGALAAEDLGWATELFGASVTASALADYVWYLAGRRFGLPAIRILCALSLSPDKCVIDTERRFNRRGGLALVLAKFVPGLSAIAPALAGALRMGWWRFLYLTVAASVLWTAAFLVAGMLLAPEIRQVLPWVAEYTAVAFVVAGAVLAMYVGARGYWRHRGTLTPLPPDSLALSRERADRQRT